ncbi:uncharacterized protein B0H64DRAFT_474018 [Chaetomium fimeti]|uniref:Protein kinase domain-containing protein n=1 Tax=Chaetomium fimeti TaxID=1854472 RepID=A0AAE0HKR4_9PEZI|nr:hypothetical protein B0H64DRAFT_474018 [Chaetomium fimeti]
MFSKGLTIRGESGAGYRLVHPLGRPTANVWKAVHESDDHSEVVAKGPSKDDDEASNWPAFQHETKMQRLFSKDPLIRHLKMENVGISGFDNEKPNENPREIRVRLADLGAVSNPGTREISALTYRSPEVHFGKAWDQSTDIWSWGTILAQLLFAQVDFSSPGMYDSIAVGSLDEKTKAVRDAMAIDFDLHSLPLYADDPTSQTMLPPARPEMAYKWAEAMMNKGISQEDIQFLANTLNPLPGGRFTTVEILESGYLDI